MWTTAAYALVGILLCLLIYRFIPLANRFDKLTRKAPRMDRRTALATFETARRTVISQLRNPYGKQISQAEADAALDAAVACLDRIDELEQKECGPANRAKIRRVLEARFRKEVDYWLQNDTAIDALGREQEPSVFAARQRVGSIPH